VVTIKTAVKYFVNTLEGVCTSSVQILKYRIILFYKSQHSWHLISRTSDVGSINLSKEQNFWQFISHISDAGSINQMKNKNLAVYFPYN
jgi:hypothetical protein